MFSGMLFLKLDEVMDYKGHNLIEAIVILRGDKECIIFLFLYYLSLQQITINMVSFAFSIIFSKQGIFKVQ